MGKEHFPVPDKDASPGYPAGIAELFLILNILRLRRSDALLGKERVERVPYNAARVFERTRSKNNGVRLRNSYAGNGSEF